MNDFFCDTGLTGEAIANNISKKIDNWQNYYEARHTMVQGQTKGATACIASKYPKAIYTHCASHRLNLCVMKCRDMREVNNMMQTADAIARFFKFSPKRQQALESGLKMFWLVKKGRK